MNIFFLLFSAQKDVAVALLLSQGIRGTNLKRNQTNNPPPNKRRKIESENDREKRENDRLTFFVHTLVCF